MNKLIIMLFILQTFLISCNYNPPISDYEVSSLTSIYAYNMEEKKVEKIEIVYDIKTPIDVFNLYTIYQNKLPIGYSSCCYTNISLLSYKENYENIVYTVDNYFKLIDDFNVFYTILFETNYIVFEKNTIIIHNNTIYTKNDKN